MQDQDQDPEEQEVGGKRRHRKRTAKNHKNVVIVGKVYADWCGHCQSLKPEWAKMKKQIHLKKGKKNIRYAEIEEKQIDTELRRLEKKHGVKITYNGFPTLFMLKKNRVHYYDGPREHGKMAQWYLNGGDSDQEQGLNQIPGLMQDQQGGRYRHRRFSRHRKHYLGQHKETRRREKTPGMFDFLFGRK
jgi:thiol-disulfide isomerase/thioredoxin